LMGLSIKTIQQAPTMRPKKLFCRKPFGANNVPKFELPQGLIL
jgi:hypothetical protein